MQIRDQQLEPGLVGNTQVGRHASGTSAYSSRFTDTSDHYLCLGLVYSLFLRRSVRILSVDRHGRILQR